jgi:hypothetical protein
LFVLFGLLMSYVSALCYCFNESVVHVVEAYVHVNWSSTHIVAADVADALLPIHLLLMVSLKLILYVAAGARRNIQSLVYKIWCCLHGTPLLARCCWCPLMPPARICSWACGRCSQLAAHQSLSRTREEDEELWWVL